MDTPLDAALKKLKLSDADFGDSCGLARGQVWAYRRGRKTPRADIVDAILTALKRHGVELLPKDLVTSKTRKRRSRKAT